MLVELVEDGGPLVGRGAEDVFVHKGIVGKGGVASEDEVALGGL